MKEAHYHALVGIRYYSPKVEIVRDATHDLEVTITSEDERKGVAFSHDQCPLARGALRETHADKVLVILSRTYIVKKKTAFRYVNPEAVKREVICTDRKALMKFAPGTYVLKAPTGGERLDALHKKKQKNGGKRLRPSAKIEHITRVFTQGVRPRLSAQKPIKKR